MPQEQETTILESPIKTAGGDIRPYELLHAQAERIDQATVEVDYHGVPGTCIDERPREDSEPRPSVLGGPDIEGLYIAELTGFFGDRDDSPIDRLRSVKRELNAAGIVSGGHKGCAAAAKFVGVMEIIATNPEAVNAYAKQQLGESYDQTAADEVHDWAVKVVTSKRYEDVSMEDVLAELLAETNEKESIEKLIGDHEGLTVVRQGRHGKTVDQTKLHELGGEDTFVFDDPYADEIEHALTAGPDATRRKFVAEHAREIALAAVANAVPNKELYQITQS